MSVSIASSNWRLSYEREHGLSPFDHLRGQIAAVLVENLRAPGDHVEAVTSVDVRHRTGPLSSLLQLP